MAPVHFLGSNQKVRGSNDYWTPPASQFIRISDGAVISTSTYPEVNRKLATEVITSSFGKHRFNRCRHVRSSFGVDGSYGPAVLLYRAGGGLPSTHTFPAWYGYIEPYTSACSLSRGSIKLGITSVFEQESKESLASRALDLMKPDLTEISFPNFLLELRDFRNGIQLWKNTIGFVKNLANLRLQYAFAVNPFLGDMVKLYQGLRGLDQKLRDWERDVGKLLVRHCDLGTFTSSHSGTTSYTATGSQTANWLCNYRAEVTGHMKYRVKPIGILGPTRRLAALADTLGFELNPSILWNAIPFSFVVDWFYSVGDSLDSMKVDTFELPIDLVDFCIQVKESTDIVFTSTLDPKSDYQQSVDFKCPTIKHTETEFNRYVYFPGTSLVSAGWKVPSWGQAINGLALGISLKR